MNGKIVWLAGGLLVAALAAVYLLRSPGPDAASAAAAPDRSGVARAGALSAVAKRHAGAGDAGAAGAQLAAREKGNGHAANAGAVPGAQDRSLSAREREFIARLFAVPGPNATEEERLAWENSPISDLIYPSDHPCAGEPIDSASPQMLTSMGREGLAKVLDAIPEVDVPQCLHQGRWNFHTLNQACSSLNREDGDSVSRCAAFLQTAPQDPKAYPATIWMPCAEGGQPTTLRAYYEELLNQQVADMFARARCSAG
jgi:hypothetical protein